LPPSEVSGLEGIQSRRTAGENTTEKPAISGLKPQISNLGLQPPVANRSTSSHKRGSTYISPRNTGFSPAMEWRAEGCQTHRSFFNCLSGLVLLTFPGAASVLRPEQLGISTIQGIFSGRIPILRTY
jgi:hypothetical protein